MNIGELFKKFKFNVAMSQEQALKNKGNSNSLPIPISEKNENSNSSIISGKGNSRRRKLEAKDNDDSNSNTLMSNGFTPAKPKDDDSIKPEMKKTKKTQENNKKESKAPKKTTKKQLDKKGSSGPLDMRDVSVVTNIDEGGTNPVLEENVGDPSVNFVFPDWLKEGNIRDINLRKPGDNGYDPSTIYIPQEAFKKMTPLMRQYWEVKQVNYDKLVAHSMFDFYWFYFYDALVTSKLLDWKIGSYSDRIQTFIHNKQFPNFAPKLLENGYKIVIVEKMTDKNEYNKKKQEIKGTKQNEELIRREVCQILTRGTYVDDINFGFDSRYTLCIFEQRLNFGVIFIDTTTHEFHIGEFSDDVQRSHLRTLLTRTKPVEVVYYQEYITSETLAIIKGLSVKPNQSPLVLDKVLKSEEIFESISKYCNPLPELLEDIQKKAQGKTLTYQDPNYYTLQALAISIQFMEQIMLAKTVLAFGNFFSFDTKLEKKGTLYLDSQALENLEVLEVGYVNNVLSKTYSLLGCMDKTSTPYGKRLFKRWMIAPLLDPIQIEERQKAVDDLLNNFKFVDQFQGLVSKLPDLERQVSRFYNLTDAQRMKAVHLDNFALNRIKDFLALLKEIKSVEVIMTRLQDYVPRFHSKRLKYLCTFQDESSDSERGLFPRVREIVENLESMVQLKENEIIPAPGVSKEVDTVLQKLEDVKASLNKILEQQRKAFKSNNINYVHSRQKYELEFPEELVENSKRPKDFIPTSKRKGYLRFHTPEIEELLQTFIPLEYEYERAIVPFAIDYFLKFYQKSSTWKQMISCLSEIDALCSLARYANELKVRCKPQILPLDEKENIFELENMVHSMAAKTNPNFIPNSVIVKHPIFLITGPNMGGKSTLLRMTCLAVIMAQMGSYVPAESFRFRAVDRIFTRIGASDRIFEGKSTFYIEMEETYHITTQATKNSLLIIDELGRGTSTYDGVSIAYATLKYIAEKINCITLFATHYHLLIEEFEIYKNIRNYYMLSEFDKEREEVRFKYKFVEGKADKSYGIIMGKMAGLPENVITTAKEKEKFMTQEKKNISYEKNLLERFNHIIGLLERLDINSQQFDIEEILSELSLGV